MRIAHVIPELIKGGAEQVVVDLANEGFRAGHEVSIIVARSADPTLLEWKLDPCVRVCVLHSRSTRTSFAAIADWVWKNREWLKTFDVVHCHLTFGATIGILVGLLGFPRKFEAPIRIYTVHSIGAPIPKWKRAISKWFSGHFDAVALVATDYYWRRHMMRWPRRLIAVIPNGIVPLATHLVVKETEQAHPYSIGTLGRLVSERRPDTMLRAMAVTARLIGPRLRILIGGAGPEKKNLEKLASQLGILSQVEFIGLVVDPRTFLCDLDLYFSLNVGPYTGIAGLEAASFGCPVIALQARSDYISGTEDWIWSTTEPEELGKTAASLLFDRTKSNDLRTRQHSYALKNHSAGTMHARYQVLYRDALKARK